MTFINSDQMNSRKQASNRYDETSMGDEQIRPVVSFSSRRSWMEPPRGILDWVREDGQAMRRTEDEDNTLGMTQKVSEWIKNNDKGEKQWVSPMMSERDWTRKCSGAGAYECWVMSDQTTCRWWWLILGWIGELWLVGLGNRLFCVNSLALNKCNINKHNKTINKA